MDGGERPGSIEKAGRPTGYKRSGISSGFSESVQKLLCPEAEIGPLTQEFCCGLRAAKTVTEREKQPRGGYRWAKPSTGQENKREEPLVLTGKLGTGPNRGREGKRSREASWKPRS